MDNENITVALLQYEAELGDKEENANRILEAIKKHNADIYVFPELYLTGYNIMNRVIYLAENIHQPSKTLSELLSELKESKKIVIFGFPEKDYRGIFYNSALIVTPNAISVYRKAHLPNFGPFRELIYYTPGEPYQSIVTVNDIRLGVQICYDIFFPETAKFYALQGADILVTISASPITSRRLFETLIAARAVENGFYHIYVNYPGVTEDLLFWGGSRVVGPRGNIIAKAKYFDEDVVIADIDLKILNAYRPFRMTYRDTLITH